MKPIQYRRNIKTKFFIYTGFLLMLFASSEQVLAQVKKEFTQRTSQYSPAKKIYSIKGDFQMIGNTNLSLANYQDSVNNSNNNMIYVNVDTSYTTLNSSSATLTFPSENGSIPECSNIIYAGLYWTGRAHDSKSVNTFDVTKTTTGPYRKITDSYKVNNGNAVPYSAYSVSTSRKGNNNAYYVSYTISGKGKEYQIEFLNESPYIKCTERLSNTVIEVKNISISDDKNTRTASFNPIELFSDLTIKQLIRDSRKNQKDNNYKTTSFVVGDVTYESNVYTISKKLDKSVIQLKHEHAAGYTTINASDEDFKKNIYYPNNSEGNMYAAYAEVTDYVRRYGIGTYTVADIALLEGNGGSTGFYGGWGLIVIYENSKMKWRDITIFDGYAYIAGNTTAAYKLEVDGFNTAQNGNIEMKLGIMAGEGDRDITGDYFHIQELQSGNYMPLKHSGNDKENFFNSSIVTGGNTRVPNLVNNTGLDIAMFKIDNPDNTIIGNNQQKTTFLYGSKQDTYSIFCIAMAVDAYIPEIETVSSLVAINNIPDVTTVSPNDVMEYSVELKNKGTEAIDSTIITIPMPYTVNFDEITAFSSSISTAKPPVFVPNFGGTGAILWDLGHVPLIAENKDSVLASLTYRVKATDECTIILNPNCGVGVTVSGKTEGVGAVSKTRVDIPFIWGYKSAEAGSCSGEPIFEPTPIPISRDIQKCPLEDTVGNIIDYSTVTLYYCNITDSVPFLDISSSFPAGSRFYNKIDTITGEPTSDAVEYTYTSTFPASTNLYYAIPGGNSSICFWKFLINIDSINTTPVASDITYCRNDLAQPLSAVKTNEDYTLYYYMTNDDSDQPLLSITPSTSEVGTFVYYVAEGISGKCISKRRTPITVTVKHCTCPNLISNKHITNFLKKNR